MLSSNGCRYVRKEYPINQHECDSNILKGETNYYLFSRKYNVELTPVFIHNLRLA